MLLWGLTLGVVSDFLEHIPPHNALELWTYPTFTNWDVRFTMWAMSYPFRKRMAREMRTAVAPEDAVAIEQQGVDPAEMPTEVPSEPEKTREEEEAPPEAGIAGLGAGHTWGRKARSKMIARGAAVNSMLEGYYPIIRKAVAVALAARITVVGLVVVYAWRKYWRR